MSHLYPFLNLSSLNLIPQWPLDLTGAMVMGWGVRPLVCPSVDELVELTFLWMISELIDCCFQLSNCFVKDCFQTLSAWGQDIGFHVLDLLYFLTSVTLKYIYYHKSLGLRSITSTTWKLEISRPRIRHRKEKGWRWWTQKCLDFEGWSFFSFFNILLFVGRKNGKASEIRSLGLFTLWFCTVPLATLCLVLPIWKKNDYITHRILVRTMWNVCERF